MTYTREVIKKAAELAKLDGLDKAGINYFLSLLDDANDIVYPRYSDLDELLNDICKLCNITPQEIRSQSRKSNLIKARVAFSVIAKDKFPEYVPGKIGKVINRDRTTVSLHYFALMENDPVMRNYCNYIKRQLKISNF